MIFYCGGHSSCMAHYVYHLFCDLSVRKFFSRSIVHCLWYCSLTHDLLVLCCLNWLPGDSLSYCTDDGACLDTAACDFWGYFTASNVPTFYLYSIPMPPSYHAVITVASIRRRGFKTSRWMGCFSPLFFSAAAGGFADVILRGWIFMYFNLPREALQSHGHTCFSTWSWLDFSKWQMRLNPSKCELLCISNKQTPIKPFYYLKPLSQMDCIYQVPSCYHRCQAFSEQACSLSHVSGRATKVCNLLRRRMFTCSSPSKHRAFRALVVPLLDYANTVWNPHSQNIFALEKLQNQGACWICGSRLCRHTFKWSKSSEECCSELFWPSLYTRQNYLLVIAIYDMLHQHNYLP